MPKENRMEAIHPEIILGSTICEQLKAIFHTESAWSECHQDIAKKFTELKVKARKFYSGKADIEILKELQRYAKEDITDMMSS